MISFTYKVDKFKIYSETNLRWKQAMDGSYIPNMLIGHNLSEASE